MKCIIIGVGKVGYSLAANLCAEGHEITIIDTDRRRLDIMADHFNVNVVEGNAAKLSTLNEADISHTDLLIAVTEKDELNMVACFVAKNSGAKAAIARVRNPAYSDFADKGRMEALGIDMLINPERVSAREIVRLLDYPEAHHVGFYGNGSTLMMELRLPEDSPRLNMPLHQLEMPAPCVVVAIDRHGTLIIPKGNDVLQAGDEVLFLSYTEDMPQIEEYLGVKPHRPRNVVIFGGSLSGYYLAAALEDRVPHLNVKLIEADADRCRELAHDLSRTVIINGGGSDVALYEDENIGEADVFIAVTEDDKENLFACVLAKNMGADRTIAQMRGSEYGPVIEDVGVDKVVSPSRLTADRILRFIDRKRILSLTRFDDTSGQVAEYVIGEGARCVGKSIMELNFPKEALICMINRGDQHLIARGSDRLEAGDSVIVFSMPEAIDKVEKLLTVEGDKE